MTKIESEQSRDVRLTELARGPFIFRFLSYRKSEDAALNLRSEDFIVSDLTQEKAVFALCDGVGSSFYGNIGSQILGEVLTSWLGKISIPGNFSPLQASAVTLWMGTLSTQLTSELNSKTALATSIVQKKEISSQDELVRLAEITQRDDFGTQSNFACGILWPQSISLPRGLILLFWLGNARIRLFSQNNDLTAQLGWGRDPNQLKEVWSSKDGVVGTIHAHVTDFAAVTHVMAYSDGLENAEQHIRPNLEAAQLEKLVKYSQSVKDDDATFVEWSVMDGEIPGMADDMVLPLRKHLQATSAAPQPDPEVQKLRAALEALQKKYDAKPKAQAKTGGVSLGLLIASSLILATLCLFSGLFLGMWIERSRATETPTPSLTPLPSPILTLTLTSTPSATPTLTDTPTFTPLPTDTATPTPTATGTDTPLPTDEKTGLLPESSATPTPTFTATPN